MVSQNVQMMDYMSSMPRGIAIPRERAKEEASSGSLIHHVVLGIIMILLPFMAATILHGFNVQAEYNMQQVRAEVMSLEKENSVLKLEVSRLDAPVRIQKIAETKLGMRLPSRNVYGGVEGPRRGTQVSKASSSSSPKTVR
ncbi:cell division protein FtsL [uncultured Dialister sp.]|uniref:cell division protein FtsL n=1 Tax=uncultured Dialister sp. TaxID=278064 RepID=UPI00265AF7FD|nr:cell division protein FtsL [uncultured Dialister sp.]